MQQIRFLIDLLMEQSTSTSSTCSLEKGGPPGAPSTAFGEECTPSLKQQALGLEKSTILLQMGEIGMKERVQAGCTGKG